ncbi:DNA polymerase III subunit gamma and tau [Pseudoclavibacter endophyticus]|uniref:DNA-directed DNA polymerase n=1 Tax=Pseudoclavibacter endophyticus TaxID=1778590 RepID=A0A6H9WMY1_9MICO|nr:DNA polymerase III subunit gamma and tau [Pseudoclavibacter endophyticus]KAB1648118.1 DNA polymerase III subunit gamma and tau [Pseudoclavibacter endophyticus]
MVAALYRRYRPDTFADMIGQAQVTEPLRTALRTGRVHHAYLFSGPRGCGKTTSARVLARCLNCKQGPTDAPCGECDSCIELATGGSGSLDVIEIDAASHGGVDDARDLRERAVLAPSRDRFKVFIIDEAHMVTSAGFNALLKVVEEPPEHVRFVFATTEPEKVIGTIRSRTHHFPFRLIPPAVMLEYVEQLSGSEGVAADPGVLPLVVRAGGGSARDTLSLLDQVIAGSEGDRIDYERAAALLGFTAAELLDGTIDAFAAGDAAAAYRTVDGVVQSGQDPRRFVEDLLERVRDLIVVKATGEGAERVLHGASPAELDRLGEQAGRFSPAGLTAMADLVNETLTEMTGATSPRLHLELMTARILVASKAVFAGDAGAGAIASIERRPDAAGGADDHVASGAGSSASEMATTATSVPSTPRPGEASAPGPTSASAEPEPSPAPSPASSPAPQSSPAAAEPLPAAEPPTPAAAEPPPAETTVPEAGGDGTHAGTQPVASGPLSFAQLRDAWPTVLDRVKRDGGTPAWTAAQLIHPRDLSDDVLSFEVDDKQKLDRFRTPPHGGGPAPSDLVRTAIRDLFGVTVKFKPRRAAGREGADASDGKGAGGSGGDADEHRARGSSDAAPGSSAPTSSAPSAAASSNGRGGGPVGLNWTVAAIPGSNREVDDGPGSAWAEAATSSEAAAAPPVPVVAETPSPATPSAPAPAPIMREPDDADRTGGDRTQHDAATTGAGVTPGASGADQARPFDLDRAPEVVALRDLEARRREEADDAAADPSAAEPVPADARAASPSPAATSEPWAVMQPGTTSGQQGPEFASTKRASAPGSPPVLHRPPEPAPGINGVERYGESVIRELLGARFVSEEALPEPVPPMGGAIDSTAGSTAGDGADGEWVPSDADAPPPDDAPPPEDD